MHRLAIASLLLAVTSASACDGDKAKSSNSGSTSHDPATSAPPAGKSVDDLVEDAAGAIQAKEWKKALASLDALLADAKATPEQKAQAWVDRVFCDVMLNGESVAKASLQKMADSKVDVQAVQYFKLGNDLADESKVAAALDVIAAATERFKGDPKAKKQLKKLAKKLAASGEDAKNALQRLGYLGGDDDE